MSFKKVKEVIQTNEVKNIYESKSDTLNYENFPAFKRKDVERLKEILFIGSTGNTFYAKQDNYLSGKIDDLKELINTIEPEVTSQLIVSARNEGFFRHIPIIALIFLKQKSPQHFKNIFNQVILTGQDLGDYLDLSKEFNILWGSAAKKAIHKWLKEKANSFYVIKYRRQIADAIAISRPNVNNFSNAEELKYAYQIKKNIKLKIKNQQLKCAIDFQKHILNNEIEKGLKKAEQGKLPSDLMISLIGKSTDEKIWTVIAQNMGVMQFLKYLNKLSTVLSEKTLIELMEQKITVENLKSAKVFPYRVFIAWHNTKNSAVKNYLGLIIEKYIYSYDFEKWKNHSFAIAPDISSSMTFKNKNSLPPSVVAGYFASVMAKGLNEEEIYLWDTKCYPLKVRDLGVFDIYDKIYNAEGGGTSMGVSIEYLIKNNIKKDIIVLITDSEHWYGGYADSFMQNWKQYKTRINQKAKCVIIEVVGYGDSQVEEEFAKKYDVFTVFGWSDSVFNWIEMKVL